MHRGEKMLQECPEKADQAWSKISVKVSSTFVMPASIPRLLYNQ
jgi:hypothetical protein